MGDLKERLGEWLALLDGPGWKGEEAYHRAIEEMRAVGSDRLVPPLLPMLADADRDVRCLAALAILKLDGGQGVEQTLPLLHDAENAVRGYVCGLMHDLGNERAVQPLMERMKHDPDPQVRGAAAYALGG